MKTHFLALWWLPFFLVPFLWPGVFTAGIAEDLLSLAAALFAVAMMWNGKSPSFSDAWAWVFLSLILISLLIHLLLGDLRSPWFAWRDTFYMTAAWLVFVMARERGYEVLSSSVFAWVLTVTAYAFVAYSLLQAYDLRFFASGAVNRLFPVWSKTMPRFPGPFMQANWQGIFLALAICAQLFQGLLNREKMNMWFALAVIPFSGLLLTSSRSALLAIIFGVGAILYLGRWDKRIFIAIGAMIAGAVALTIAINHSVPNINGVQNVMARFDSGGYMNRLLIWAMCFHLVLSHFFLGIGWGNLPAYSLDAMIDVVRQHQELGKSVSSLVGGNAWAHNILLQGWLEGGIPGLLAVILLCIAVLKRWLTFNSMRLATLDGRVLGALFAGMLLLDGMVSVAIMQPNFMSILALSLAAAYPRQTEHESMA